MQTLHLRFRALRAISPGQSPSRWQTPSMRSASKWETASPLPNPLGPTCAVGSRPASTPGTPGPTHPDGIPCPVAGAGLPGVSRLRAARKNSRVPVLPCRVCRWQTAPDPVSHPAPQKAGDGMLDHGQARASEDQWSASGGLSFPLRSHRSWARSSGEKMVAQLSDGSGTRCSEAPGFRPTGRLKPAPSTRVTGQAPTSSCADAPAFVTGQEPVGMGMPGVSHRQRLRLRRGAR